MFKRAPGRNNKSHDATTGQSLKPQITLGQPVEANQHIYINSEKILDQDSTTNSEQVNQNNLESRNLYRKLDIK